jgi:hypothetical protein
MMQFYPDIRSRIASPPIWWDEHAVPRYCEFEPSKMVNSGAGEAALVEIECQNCRQLFRVAFSNVNWRDGSIAEAIRAKVLSYGDPPIIPCCVDAGSMTSMPRRVLEYWHRHDPKYVGAKDGFKNVVLDLKAWDTWTRDVALEIDIRDASTVEKDADPLWPLPRWS